MGVRSVRPGALDRRGDRLGGCGDDEPAATRGHGGPAPITSTPSGRGDSSSARSHRPAPCGLPAAPPARGTLRPLLPNGRLEPVPGEPGLRNVVGTLPGRRPGIVVGAHYDTLVEPHGFVGANNGAAGTAVVIEAARALSRMRRPAGRPRGALRPVRRRGAGGRVARGERRTSTARDYAVRAPTSPAIRTAPRRCCCSTTSGIAACGSHARAARHRLLWDRVRAAARRVGAARFFPGETGARIVDDHTPFLRAGVPAVDLIDWSYPGHERSDRLDKLSRQSLDAVGETVVELVRTCAGRRRPRPLCEPTIR